MNYWPKCSSFESVCFLYLGQGSHSLEKYLNIQDWLEKSLKIKFALKVLEKHSKTLNYTIDRRVQQCCRDLNQYKTVVLLSGAAYAAPNECTPLL